MHTASYEFLMKPKELAGCHQTLSSQLGSGDETNLLQEWNHLQRFSRAVFTIIDQITQTLHPTNAESNWAL